MHTTGKMTGFSQREFWALDQHRLDAHLAFVRAHRLRGRISYVIAGEET